MTQKATAPDAEGSTPSPDSGPFPGAEHPKAAGAARVSTRAGR